MSVPASRTPPEAIASPAVVSERRVLDALLRQNLSAFTQRCFTDLMPAQPYKHSWHLDALAYRLSEVAAGRTKRLIITLPPRSLKSLSASIAFPAWLLGHDPHRRIICVSYGRSLTVQNANSFRRVVGSSWYKSLFPMTRVDPKKDTEDEVRTSVGGYRLTATVGGALTGRGGSIVIIDDPLEASDAQSEAGRTNVNQWFDETLLSRLDDKRNDAIVLVMQRLHVDDLVGHVLKSGEWTHLDLPAIADTDAVIPLGGKRIHRRAVGDLLHPEREDQSVIDELRRSMGSAAFSAQYLQRPVPARGHMIDLNWFRRWRDMPTKQGYRSKIVQSWDAASKADQIHDYSVGVTAMVTGEEIAILDVVRARLEYPQLKRRILEHKRHWNADIVLIEDKGSGTSLIQDLKRERVFAKPIKPEGDKIVRMSACTAQIEAGAVLLPQSAPWLDQFCAELQAFPFGQHDDQVDALSQLINWTRTGSTYTLANVG